MAGRFSQPHLFVGNPSECPSVSTLCDGPRTVYLSFDADTSGAGQQASEQLAHRLGAHGILTRRIVLPEGHDPNSFFLQGGDRHRFQSLMEAARS